jgi:hypothetical protein
MALYELSEEQVRNLRTLIANANIKGADAPTIIELINALSRPIQSEATPKEIKETK